MSPSKAESEKDSDVQVPAGSSWSLPWSGSSTPKSDNKASKSNTDVEEASSKSDNAHSTPLQKGLEVKTSTEKGQLFQKVKNEGLVMPLNTISSQEESSEHAPDDQQNESLRFEKPAIETQGEDSVAKESNEIAKKETPDQVVYDGIEKTCQSTTDRLSNISQTEISDISEVSGGWEISDSVLKLVEEDERLNTETMETPDAKNSTIESNIVSVDEADVGNKHNLSRLGGVGESVTNSSLEEERQSEYFSKCDSESLNTPFTSETPKEGESVLMETHLKTVSNIPQDEYVSDQLESSCEIIPNIGESKCIDEEVLIQETSVKLETSTQEDFLIDRLSSLEPKDIINNVEHPNDSQSLNDAVNQDWDSASGLLPQKQDSSASFSDLDAATSSTGSSETSRLDISADTVTEKGFSETELKEQMDKSYSLFGTDKSMGLTEGETTSIDNLSTSISPASSFVKCMLEEAMEESGKEDSGSDNHSSEGKSDSSKIDSELEKSIYSGHESSDDIETTTSSDIEIISAPLLSSSEKQYSANYDLPALKINIQPRSTGAGGRGHRRSDSQSSSSTQSKGVDHERLSPDRGEGTGWADEGKTEFKGNL